MQSSGVTSDGTVTAATNYWNFSDDDTLTWKSTNRIMGNEPLAETAELTLKTIQVTPLAAYIISIEHYPLTGIKMIIRFLTLTATLIAFALLQHNECAAHGFWRVPSCSCSSRRR